MSKSICCPTCQSENIRSIDNQSLYHPSKGDSLKPDAMRYDNEVYVEFICHECYPEDEDSKSFTLVFDLVLQPKQPNI